MKRIGTRRYRATFKQHDGTLDSSNQPTYTTTGDWDVVLSGVPVAIETVTGTETKRGLQVTPETSHVAFCDFPTVETVTPDMKCEISGITYGIVSVLDRDGMRREAEIQLRRQV